MACLRERKQVNRILRSIEILPSQATLPHMTELSGLEAEAEGGLGMKKLALPSELRKGELAPSATRYSSALSILLSHSAISIQSALQEDVFCGSCQLTDPTRKCRLYIRSHISFSAQRKNVLLSI